MKDGPGASVPLESVLCTEELQRRPSRPPDYQAENHALLALARELTAAPGSVLQKLADIALVLCRAHSAGISLLEEDGPPGSLSPRGNHFRWHAVAGQWATLAWTTTTPRDDGPCGTVLDRNSALLFSNAHRYYKQLAGVHPLLVEGLLVPFHVDGQAVGTVWVIAHDETRKFDAEDQRLLESLATFAATAYQTRLSIGAHAKANQDLQAEVVEGERARLEIARLNREMLEREHRLRRTILDSMAEKYYALDKDWRYTEFNSHAEAQLRTLGKDPAMLIGKVVWDEFPNTPVEEAFRQAGRNRVPLVIEHYYAPVDEWVEDRAYPTEDGGITVFQRYITDRKRDEEERRRREVYFADAQALSHTGSWVWNRRTQELSWSAEHYRIFGLDPAQGAIPYRLAIGMIHPDDRPMVEETFARAVAEDGTYTLDCRIVRPDGNIRYVRSIGHPIRGESGHTTEYVGTLIDRTETVRAEAVLRKSQQELAHLTRVMSMGALTATIGHELSQFVLAIVTNGSACLRWLSRDEPNVEQGVAAVTRIIRDANLASDVIANVRAFLQKAGGAKQSVNLADVIREIRPLVDVEAARQGVVIDEWYADDLPAVLGVRIELQQVLLNLFLNGIEAMEDVSDRPRRLWVRCQRHDAEHGPGVLVAVEDTGAGLSRTASEQLFEPFYTTKPHGLGMGLAIARSIVQSHGGRLWAAANPEHGATFQFIIPAAPE